MRSAPLKGKGIPVKGPYGKFGFGKKGAISAVPNKKPEGGNSLLPKSHYKGEVMGAHAKVIQLILIFPNYHIIIVIGWCYC